MGSFSNSVKREVGKNTGKWLSNKLFGDGHSTPYRAVANKQNEARKKEREAIKRQRDLEKNKLEREKLALQEKKIRQRKVEARRIENARVQRELEREEQEQMKQELISSNEEEVTASIDFLKAIQDIHKVPPSPIDLEQYQVSGGPEAYVTENWSSFFHQDDAYLDYIDCLMILACLAAAADTSDALPGKAYSKDEADELIRIGEILGLSETESNDYWNYLSHSAENNHYNVCCKTLRKAPLLLRYQAIALVKGMAFATEEKGSPYGSKSERLFSDQLMADLGISDNQFYWTFEFRRCAFLLNSALYHFNHLLQSDGPNTSFDVSPYLSKMEQSIQSICNKNRAEIDKLAKEIEALENEPENEDWQSEAAEIVMKEMRIETNIDLIKEEVKNDMEQKTPRLLSGFMKAGKLDFMVSGQIERIARKILEERLAEKERLLNTEPYLTYSVLTKKIIALDKKKMELEDFIESLETTLKQAKAQLVKEINDFHQKCRERWSGFKKMMSEDLRFGQLVAKAQKGELAAVKELLQEFKTLSFLEEYGCEYRIGAANEHLRFDIVLNTKEVVPATKKELREKGLSVVEKGLPASEFNSIAQDFLCSVVLRSSSELFVQFPKLNHFVIHVYDNLMNTAKGVLEEMKLIEVTLDRTIFSSICLSHVDPSDALELFKPRMKFSKSTGFKPL